jgi:hypothetical protein
MSVAELTVHSTALKYTNPKVETEIILAFIQILNERKAPPSG